MSGTTETSRPVGPVHRAFGLLQLVVAADGPVGVRDLARRSGLSRSTTGRMLGILAELGMVERTTDGAAVPGAALAMLTSSVDVSLPVVRERLRPLTADLLKEFDENAAIGVDDDSAFLYIDSARLDTAVQVPDPVGERFDFHLVAPGLVAMAEWPDARLADYLAVPLLAATEHSVTRPDHIRARLRRIRRDGFVWTDQELDLDVNGLAVPVRSSTGELLAVATLYGPAYRLNADASPDLGSAVAGFVAARAATILGT
jgi:DNA-binding IclR family transcriptional regulator